MFSFSHHKWEDFFDSSVQYVSYANQEGRLDNKTTNCYYISHCLFNTLNSAGAIRIEDSTSNKLKFLVDTSSFNKCEHKTSEGGSLYLISAHGEFIQDRICSFGSKSENGGAYCYVKISSARPFRNYLLDSTITSSGDESNKGFYNLYLYNGEVFMRSINISFSKLSYRNFYQIYCHSDSNITLSTFSNNTSTFANSYEAFHTGSSSLKFKIRFCNYFENSCNWLIGIDYDLLILNCSFSNNNVKTKYFSVNNDKRIQLKGCYLDNPEPKTSGSFTMMEGKSYIYPDNHHLSSKFCLAKIKLEFPTKAPIRKVIQASKYRYYSFRFIRSLEVILIRKK